MNTVKEIKDAVLHFSEGEMSNFSSWFDNYRADAWDDQIEKDIHAGKFDALGQEALKDLEEGRVKEL